MTSIDLAASLLSKAPVQAPVEPSLKRAEPRPNDRDRSGRGDGQDDFTSALNSAGGVPGAVEQMPQPANARDRRSTSSESVARGNDSSSNDSAASRQAAEGASTASESAPRITAGSAQDQGARERGSSEPGNASANPAVAVKERAPAGPAALPGSTDGTGTASGSAAGRDAASVEIIAGNSAQVNPGKASETSIHQAALLGRLAAQAGAEQVELKPGGAVLRLFTESGGSSATVEPPVVAAGQASNAAANQASIFADTMTDGNPTTLDSQGSLSGTPNGVEPEKVTKQDAAIDGAANSRAGSDSGKTNAHQSETSSLVDAAGKGRTAGGQDADLSPGTTRVVGSVTSMPGGQSGRLESSSHHALDSGRLGVIPESGQARQDSQGSAKIPAAPVAGEVAESTSVPRAAVQGVQHTAARNGAEPPPSTNSRGATFEASGKQPIVVSANSDAVRPSGEMAAVPAGAEAPPAMESTTQESRLTGGRAVSSINTGVVGYVAGPKTRGQTAATPVTTEASSQGRIQGDGESSGRVGDGSAIVFDKVGAAKGAAEGIVSPEVGKSAGSEASSPAPAVAAGRVSGGHVFEQHGSGDVDGTPNTTTVGKNVGGHDTSAALSVPKADESEVPRHGTTLSDQGAIRSSDISGARNARNQQMPANGGVSQQGSGTDKGAVSANGAASSELQSSASTVVSAGGSQSRGSSIDTGVDAHDGRSTANVSGPWTNLRSGPGEQPVSQAAGHAASTQPAQASDSGSGPRILDVTEMPEFLPHTLRAAVKDGVREANIRLWPPELGALKVQLQVHGNQVVARIQAERPEAYALLDRMRGALQRGMQESGLTLQRLEIDLGGSATLRAASSSSANQFERNGDPSQRDVMDPGHGDRNGTPSSPSNNGREETRHRERGDSAMSSQTGAIRGGRQNNISIRRSSSSPGGVDAWA